ncbi:MAG: aminoglycoside phosphotransferase family protein [Caldilineaceae bacterium]|nr:aminoglycoside phosphotransferase family protein [Caldilineaceae bacterium]
MTGKMHADEVMIEASLVARLLADQFPHWANLPLAPVPSAGTDNALFRLGAELAVRLPRIHWAAGQVEKEMRWLPRLAPHLPLAIPQPLALGEPGHGYPWRWGVYRWLEGETANPERVADPRQAALDLAEFVAAIQRIDPTGAPAGRGVPLAERDAAVRTAIVALRDTYDADGLTAAWETSLHTRPWPGPPVWHHGDLQGGNLLARRGRLAAVIDFGCMGVGDPACDVMAAWLYLSADTRQAFRDVLQVDDDTWARGKGWALSMGLMALPYYRTTNPVLAGIGRRAIDEVLADS